MLIKKPHLFSVVLEECKHVVKEKKIRKYIIDDIEISSESDGENSDEENCDEETFDKETSNEEGSDEKNSYEENTFFSIYIKMTNNYYQKNKEKLQKEARKRYQNLSKEEKDKKRQYTLKQHRNFSEEEKEKRHQYGRERYKNFLEDDCRKFFFWNVRNKDYLRTKHLP